MKGSRRLAPRHQQTVEARQCAVGLEPLCGAPDGLCMRLWSWMNPSAGGPQNGGEVSHVRHLGRVRALSGAILTGKPQAAELEDWGRGSPEPEGTQKN